MTEETAAISLEAKENTPPPTESNASEPVAHKEDAADNKDSGNSNNNAALPSTSDPHVITNDIDSITSVPIITSPYNSNHNPSTLSSTSNEQDTPIIPPRNNDTQLPPIKETTINEESKIVEKEGEKEDKEGEDKPSSSAHKEESTNPPQEQSHSSKEKEDKDKDENNTTTTSTTATVTTTEQPSSSDNTTEKKPEDNNNNTTSNNEINSNPSTPTTHDKPPPSLVASSSNNNNDQQGDTTGSNTNTNDSKGIQSSPSLSSSGGAKDSSNRDIRTSNDPHNKELTKENSVKINNNNNNGRERGDTGTHVRKGSRDEGADDAKGKKKIMDKLFGWIKKDILKKEKSEDSNDKSNDKEHGEGSTAGEKGDKEKEPEEEPREKKIIVVTSIEDFPEDCQKLIKQCGIPREKLEANFKILMNVLHFRTGKIFKTPETVNDPPRPVLPKSARLKKGEELVTDAVEFKKLYKDMEELGKGGFGSVFQARSTKDKKKLVAIKRMVHKTRKHKAANFHEAAILSICNHPNIVKYSTCHEINNELWVVMELMEGGTFEDAAKAWHFSEANIAYIARELLKGIAYMHANQLAHRDLKSANIMMSVRGEVKIIDLGLCADMSVGFPTHMVGSPFWMPPEMIQCKPHGYAVDIWSFAISLLEIANQRPPMIESAVKAMFTVGTEGVTEMFLEPEKWSNTFKDFLGLCLKVDPEERATATDLLNHAFIKKADTRANMENILRRIFLSNSLLNSGF